MSLKFRTLSGPWTFADTTYSDDVEIDEPSAELVEAAGHAHAAGVLQVSEGLDLSTVQSQEDAEQAQVAAMGEHRVEDRPDGTRRSYWTGPWHEGNVQQHVLDLEAKLAQLRAELPDDDAAEGEEPDEATAATLTAIAAHERNLDAAQRELATWRTQFGGENA